MKSKRTPSFYASTTFHADTVVFTGFCFLMTTHLLHLFTSSIFKYSSTRSISCLMKSFAHCLLNLVQITRFVSGTKTEVRIPVSRLCCITDVPMSSF